MTSAGGPRAGRPFKYDTPTEPKNVTMPGRLIADLADLARVNDLPFSALMVHLGIEALKNPKKFGLQPIPPVSTSRKSLETDSLTIDNT